MSRKIACGKRRTGAKGDVYRMFFVPVLASDETLHFRHEVGELKREGASRAPRPSEWWGSGFSAFRMANTAPDCQLLAESTRPV